MDENKNNYIGEVFLFLVSLLITLFAFGGDGRAAKVARRIIIILLSGIFVYLSVQAWNRAHADRSLMPGVAFSPFGLRSHPSWSFSHIDAVTGVLDRQQTRADYRAGADLGAGYTRSANFYAESGEAFPAAASHIWIPEAGAFDLSQLNPVFFHNIRVEAEEANAAGMVYVLSVSEYCHRRNPANPWFSNIQGFTSFEENPHFWPYLDHVLSTLEGTAYKIEISNEPRGGDSVRFAVEVLEYLREAGIPDERILSGFEYNRRRELYNAFMKATEATPGGIFSGWTCIHNAFIGCNIPANGLVWISDDGCTPKKDRPWWQAFTRYVYNKHGPDLSRFIFEHLYRGTGDVYGLDDHADGHAGVAETCYDLYSEYPKNWGRFPPERSEDRRSLPVYKKHRPGDDDTWERHVFGGK